ncbi:MAG: CarD family transcriptional regulator [Saccharofermentanales bacterium]
MYQIDDYVVYGSAGVCRIVDIRQESFGDAGDREYYVLDSVYGNRMQTYIPVDNISVTMRPALKKEEVLDLIQSLPDIDSEWIQDDNQRRTLFAEILQSCDPAQIAYLIKMIYHRQKELQELGKRLTSADSEALKTAEKLLYDEFALVLDIQIEQVIPFIAEKIPV